MSTKTRKHSNMDMMRRVNELFKQYSVALEAVPAEEKVDDPAKAVATEMAEATLEDGTVIYTEAETFDVGAMVFVLSPDGTQIPLPDGEYMLNDGAKIIVVEGAVTEYMAGAPAEAEAPVVEEEMGSVSRADIEDMVVRAVAQAMKTQMSAIKDLTDTIQSQKQVIAKLSKTAPLARTREIVEEPVKLDGLKGIELVQALQKIYS